MLVFFDLILATAHRRAPLPNLFDSLAAQSHRDFRVLLIDQNPEGHLDEVLARARVRPNAPEIIHLRSEVGLSRARNVGLAHLQGDAFALVDDDLTYEPDTLATAAAALASCDIAIGNLLTPDAKRPSPARPLTPRPLRWIHEAFYAAPSATLFFRRDVARKLPAGFPEDIGAGADSPYGSGAETDFLIRAMLEGFQAARHPEIIIRHPLPDFLEKGARLKGRRYGRGRHHIIRKHRLGAWFVALNALHSAGRMLSKPCDPAHLHYYWQMFLGRLGR